MEKYIDILGYKIFSRSIGECIDEIFSKDKVHVVSGNPEVLFNGLNSELLKLNFTSEDALIIPDGVGTQISAKILKTPVYEKIAGIECMGEILKKCERENRSVYFLGAKEETINLAVEKIRETYPNLNIVGWRNGYFNKEEEKNILDEINNLKPYALFVAMGCPKQEEFIINNMNSLDVSIFMGIGGSLDVISGSLKRAPKWMIKIGMEWAYRVIKEPFRIKRLGSIPKFIFMVYKNRRRG